MQYTCIMISACMLYCGARMVGSKSRDQSLSIAAWLIQNSRLDTVDERCMLININRRS